MNFIKYIDAKLAQLNTKLTAFIGAVLFAPALTMLMDQSFAESAVHAVLPHAPDVEVKIIAGSVAAAAAYLLYQGKPHNAELAK